jgi:hypothetical protein
LSDALHPLREFGAEVMSRIGEEDEGRRRFPRPPKIGEKS